VNNDRGQAITARRKPRTTFRLKNWRIPRDAFVHGFTFGGDGMWATPTCYSRSYPDAEMSETGSRVCTGPSRSTSTWMLENQVMIEEVNKDAFAWQAFLRFVRESLPLLITPILDAQHAYLGQLLDEGHLDAGCAPSQEDGLVLRAYHHNVSTAREHYPGSLIDAIGVHEEACRRWTDTHSIEDSGPCPQQLFLLDLFLQRGPTAYVPIQIAIWESCDAWSLLPLAKQLPEVGPDMEDLGAGAWDILWWPTGPAFLCKT